LLSFGGQTALNCGLTLYKRGILKKYNVEVLGTPIEAILLSEDRKKFAKHLQKIDVSTPPSFAVISTQKALQVAERIGYPVMVRAGFALGGQGSGIAKNERELEALSHKAFAFVQQILVEKYLHHFKEVEYEVVRDKYDNCVTVCNMENMDPLGIHTGESIVVAPSQTLTNFEYHTLRKISIEIVRSLKIVGECNVQFALNPNPKSNQFEYYVIELNARLSRSSALASKATGYPLAYVAAKLALGKSLMEIKNKVTQITQSCFEPSLDYIVVKIPRWDTGKFKGAEEKIGTSMKSVGEVMGIGRNFEEAYQKAIRMLDLDFEGATDEKTFGQLTPKNLKQLLVTPTPRRIFAIAEALRKNMSVKQIYKLTGIDPWFLSRIQNIVKQEESTKKLQFKQLTAPQLWSLKKHGFSDKKIGEFVNSTGLTIRQLRKKLCVTPSVFQIDTLSGEFPACTNYLYLTYNGSHHDIKPANKSGVIVLGSGPYRIGSSVEFDWTSVSTVLALWKFHKESIIINCNPETVSTDYDVSDRLYFEELTFERIADIYDFEQPHGIIISVGGQTPNNRAKSLDAYGCNILGTTPGNIDKAEDRTKFSKLLDDLSIYQPLWNKFSTVEDVLRFCEKAGYPVLIRPSYVLSGTSMNICNTKEELEYCLANLNNISKKYPITVSKFIQEAKEIEFDGVAQSGTIIASVIS
ncbi:MAG: carbamoyl-phosphate synthase large subunit, partial [Patescibacteria group bacterium]